MKLLWISLSALLFQLAAATFTTESLVKKHGYPFEEHLVKTSDGYILGVHRIPHSSKYNDTSGKPRPVAFLMHGLLSSSSDWIILGPDNALGFILSDAGYDVWMGNARGNVYSRRHASRMTLFKDFWRFGWHEIGTIDLPAMIEYICDITGQEQVTYFGHSQGTTTFFVMTSMNTEIQPRIKSAHLMAPVVFVKNLVCPFMKMGALMMNIPSFFLNVFGSLEFMPSSAIIETLGNIVCNSFSPIKELCSNALFLIAGFDPDNLNKTLLPEILGTTPGGASTNQIYHFLQEHISGHFRQYDFGMAQNLIKYGSISPPDYPLDKIHVPIYLYYSNNDYLSSVTDVERLMKELPKSTLKGAYLVSHKSWNHFDFLWGLNVRELLYNTMMKNVASVGLLD